MNRVLLVSLAVLALTICSDNVRTSAASRSNDFAAAGFTFNLVGRNDARLNDLGEYAGGTLFSNRLKVGFDRSDSRERNFDFTASNNFNFGSAGFVARFSGLDSDGMNAFNFKGNREFDFGVARFDSDFGRAKISADSVFDLDRNREFDFGVARFD